MLGECSCADISVVWQMVAELPQLLSLSGCQPDTSRWSGLCTVPVALLTVVAAMYCAMSTYIFSAAGGVLALRVASLASRAGGVVACTLRRVHVRSCEDSEVLTGNCSPCGPA